MPDLTDRLRSLPADTLTALAFFSRVPVRPTPLAFDLRRSAGAWPVAGALLALGPAVVFLLARWLEIPSGIAGLLALALLAAITGGMHEDGLADTADGFGGRAAREAKLALMRDSRLGTYGGLALIFTVAVKAAALGALGAPAWQGALALVAVAALSRASAVWHWHATLPARTDGMAFSAGRPDRNAFAVASLAAALAALLLLAGFGAAALFALLLAAAGTWLFSRLSERQIGGHTGDTIGAAQQIAETVLLAGLTVGSSPLA
jgi:adenosylcobinamide-GDP ribazoletransferase